MIGKWQQVSLHPSLTLPRQNPFLPNQLSQLPEKTTFSITYQTIVALEQAEVSKKYCTSLAFTTRQGLVYLGKTVSNIKTLSDSAEDQLVKNLLHRHASYHAEKNIDTQQNHLVFTRYSFANSKPVDSVFKSVNLLISPKQAVIAQSPQEIPFARRT